MIAACYLRKSNDEGDKTAELKSVTVQKSLAAAFAAARGWTIEDRYVFEDDGVSGAEFDDRPGLQKMLSALKTSPVPFQAVIVTEQSRLGRETLDTLIVIRQIERAGVAIWSVNDGRQITLANDSSEIMTMLTSWKSSSERRDTIVRVRNAAFKRHADGYVAGGRVYGYTNVRLPGVKGGVRREPNEAEAAIVRRIFTMTADGYGLTRIALVS